MDSCAREQQQWVVQPLLDAGVDLDRIRDLVFRLAFEDIVSEGRETLRCVTTLVGDQAPAVQAAWLQTLVRMLTVELPT